jgi:hypothetical protein
MRLRNTGKPAAAERANDALAKGIRQTKTPMEALYVCGASTYTEYFMKFFDIYKLAYQIRHVAIEFEGFLKI